MAFGYEIDDIDARMKAILEMDPGELEEFLEYEEEETDNIPEGHLVAYLDECVKESHDSSKDRRETDQKLWQAHENLLDDFSDKEDWQSKIILNKPFTTTLQAKSIIRRGLIDHPEYFSIESDADNPEDELKAKFWEKSLRYWTGTKDVQFPFAFADATEMGFTVGQSMAVKILYEPDENGIWGLRLHLVEPWKIYYDPDRQSRRPWSGLYSIHEEWVDFHVLKDKELQGHYQNIDQVRTGKNVTDGRGMSLENKEEERRRKGQTHHRNKYRHSVLVREFWGTVLNEHGEIAMQNARFTVANGVVIRAAAQNPIPKLKWPWGDFSPLPHLFRDHGYSIYEGTLSVWKFQNALLNLYIDNENWRINNMYEVDVSKLQDPTDDEIYPGKKFIRKRGSEGPAIIPVIKNPSNLADIDFLWRLTDNIWENGTMVSPVMKGEGLDRKVTKAEYIGTREMGSEIFNSIGRDIEHGGMDLLWAIKEVLTAYWDEFDPKKLNSVFRDDQALLQFAYGLNFMPPEDRMAAMELDKGIKIEGVSRLFEEAKITRDILAMAEMGQNPQYSELLEADELFRKFARQHNQEDLVKSEDEIEAERQQKEIAARKGQIEESIRAALDTADKARGVDIEAPGSTEQQLMQGGEASGQQGPS